MPKASHLELLTSNSPLTKDSQLTIQLIIISLSPYLLLTYQPIKAWYLPTQGKYLNKTAGVPPGKRSI